MKKSDEFNSHDQSSLEAQYRKLLEEAIKFKSDKYAELAEEYKKDEAKLVLGIKKKFFF